MKEWDGQARVRDSGCPCGHTGRHLHTAGAKHGRDIDALRMEAIGYCPDTGMPFEMCMGLGCECHLTCEALPEYLIGIRIDLDIIERNRGNGI